jgi:hypothetical protein
MTTQTQVKKISNAITGMESKVADTMVQVAHDIASACQSVFKGLTPEAADIKAIQDQVADSATWKGSSSEGARRSEIKSIVVAYPYLETACKVFKREFGELRREHFVKLARMAPQYETPTDAALDTVAFFEERGASTGNAATPKQKLAAGLSQAIANVGENAALKRALYNLCKKHSIKVK